MEAAKVATANAAAEGAEQDEEAAHGLTDKAAAEEVPKDAALDTAKEAECNSSQF